MKIKTKYIIDLIAYFGLICVGVAFICAAFLISNQHLIFQVSIIGVVAIVILTLIVGRLVLKNAREDPPTRNDKFK
ncbi:MAG: hypothetical protein JST48_05625 [Bacteroidetes bacterium]|nr:hypothetical protein [Bacteroidota bacterium]